MKIEEDLGQILEVLHTLLVIIEMTPHLKIPIYPETRAALYALCIELLVIQKMHVKELYYFITVFATLLLSIVYADYISLNELSSVKKVS